MWRASFIPRLNSNAPSLRSNHKNPGYLFVHLSKHSTMADNEEDLVDYDEEEEEQNVAAEETADAEGKEVKK